MASTKMQAMANARELLKTYLSIKNELNSAEVRDPANKKTYPIAPFLKMGNYHIPTNVEMSNGKGLNRRNWKVNHVFGTAKYYTDTCLLYTSPSPRDRQKSRMPSSA